MNWPYQLAIEYLIAALNRDILREIRMADECIQRAGSMAQPYAHLQSLIVRCAASAMTNASALASEVLSLGGVPHAYTPKPPAKPPGATSIEEYFVQAQLLVANYQERLVMAEKLGLLRLREVLLEIIANKRSYLKHAVVIAAAGKKPRQLS